MFYKQYTLADWLLFFYIYCFIGWCIESTFVSVNSKKFVNRGFMRGPFLPLYGSGAVIMLFVTIPVRDNLVLTFLFGAVGATILEYITGATMEALFKVRYWDYSKQPFNINGHVCLGTSLSWGVLTILMVNIIHTPVEQLVLSISPFLKSVVVWVLTIGIAADFALSFKAALDIRYLLAKMTSAKAELEKVQHRLDAIIAFSGEKIAQQAENFSNKFRLSETLLAIKSKLDALQPAEKAEDSGIMKQFAQFRDELEQIRIKYYVENEKRKAITERLGFFKKDLLKAHPTITSTKFEEALKELKEIAEEKHDKKDS